MSEGPTVSSLGITLKIEAVSSFETSVNFYRPTQRYIPDRTVLSIPYGGLNKGLRFHLLKCSDLSSYSVSL